MMTTSFFTGLNCLPLDQTVRGTGRCDDAFDVVGAYLRKYNLSLFKSELIEGQVWTGLP